MTELPIIEKDLKSEILDSSFNLINDYIRNEFFLKVITLPISLFCFVALILNTKVILFGEFNDDNIAIVSYSIILLILLNTLSYIYLMSIKKSLRNFLNSFDETLNICKQDINDLLNKCRNEVHVNNTTINLIDYLKQFKDLKSKTTEKVI